jgi:hypothetical protein
MSSNELCLPPADILLINNPNTLYRFLTFCCFRVLHHRLRPSVSNFLPSRCSSTLLRKTRYSRNHDDVALSPISRLGRPVE